MNSNIPQTILTRSADIERIEGLVSQRPSLARVRITLRDGKTYVGTVVERPAAQQFRDKYGYEGTNALVRLDDPVAPPRTVDLWLSDIEQIEQLGSFDA